MFFLVAGIFFYFLDAKTVLALLIGAIRADMFRSIIDDRPKYKVDCAAIPTARIWQNRE